MQRARVNGVELEYEIKGAGEPVLLIHGSHIGGSFVPLVAQPSMREGYQLIRYHRRGFLGSEPPKGPVSIAEQAADAKALLEHLNVRRAHVVGHSYGGPIALQLAVDAPELVHSLALLEAALLSVPGAAAVIDLVAVAARLYREGDWEAAEDLFLGSPKERADIARNVPGGLEQALQDMDTYFTVEVPAHEQWQFTAEQGRRIRQPVLFMLGSESSPLYVQCRDLVLEWMPQTETVVLPGASHLLHIQQPEGAAALLREFFGRHPISVVRRVDTGRPRRSLHPADRYNATTDLLDGNLERGRGGKVAIRTPSAEWTYAEVAAGANRAGNALRALGLEVENRVLMAVLDSPEFATTFFGAIKMGAIPVPVNTGLRAEEYAALLHDSRARVAVVSEPVAAALRQARPEAAFLRHLVVIGTPGPGELSFDEITRAAGEELPPADTTVDDMCFWLYSSGTTGQPKGVVHLQRAMRACADSYGRSVLGLQESDVAYSVSKLYFAYGLGGGLYLPFAAGASTVLIGEPPQPRMVLNVIGQFRPTVYFGVPTSYGSILAAHPSAWKAADFGATRLYASAGEPLPEVMLRQWKERTGVEILDGIGSTESCHIFISNRADDVRPDCSGTVVQGYEAKVVDDEGREVPAGEPGTLMVKGDSVFALYWRQHRRTRKTLLGEWLTTGDIYVRDDSGHFFYQGRTDDLLKVGGMWVSPLEIERVLEEDERVAECAVVGVRDRHKLVKPEAFVVVEDGSGEDELELALRRLVRQRLGGNKTPRAFHFIEALPKTANGNVQRHKLREQAEQG